MALTLGLLSLSLFAQEAKVVVPRTHAWSDKWMTDINKNIDRSGSQVTNVIFDQIDEFTHTFVDNIDFKLRAGVKRTVFDNQDVLGTWTVNDNFRIEMGHDKTEYSVNLGPAGISPIAFKLGINGAISVSHIRQVKSYLYNKLPSVADEQEESVEEQVTKSRWFEFDPSTRPRLFKIWNPLLAATKIPWTKKLVQKLGDGELVSYSSSGYISTGVELGIIPVKFHKDVNLNLSVGAKIYLSGEFRITVLKESERYVRVKVTKINTRGTELNTGSSVNDVELFEGFTAFGEEHLGRVKVNITPFNFSYRKERKGQYDLGFRYDLHDEQAIEAYEDAVVGQFKLSELLSKKKHGVTHILNRRSVEKSRQNSLTIGFSWLAKVQNNRKRSDMEATIILPEGEKKIFKSSTELSKNWSTVWGDGEKKSYNFITLFDKNAYMKGEDNSFQLVTEGLIEDVRTSGEEMSRYSKNIETILGNADALPELPLFVPQSEEKKKLKKAFYKRSSFYFGQFFSQKQVEKFILTPEDVAEKISRKSFSYEDQFNGNVKTRQFFKRWMNIQKDYKAIKNSDDLAIVLKDLADMFKLYSRSIEGMNAILLSLSGEEIDYFLTASNNAFGRIQLRGKHPTNAEKLLNLADETINFENTVGTNRPDPAMQIKELKAEQLNDQTIKLSFILPKNPKYLFFRMLRSSGWKKIKNIKELIFYNKNKFKEGLNEWVVGPNSSSTLERAIYESFTRTEYYTIQMSLSQDRLSWGRAESVRVLVKIPELEKENKKEMKTKNSD